LSNANRSPTFFATGKCINFRGKPTKQFPITPSASAETKLAHFITHFMAQSTEVPAHQIMANFKSVMTTTTTTTI